MKYYQCIQLLLYNICFQDIVVQKYMLKNSFQSSEDFYIDGQFEKEMVYLTNGDEMENDILSENHENMVGIYNGKKLIA